VSGDERVSKTLAELLSGLRQPLSDDDREAGWNERSREDWLGFFEGFEEGWVSRGPQPEKARSPFQLAKALDGTANPGSPLGGLFIEFQRALNDRLKQL
jgi:hypothetical protein